MSEHADTIRRAFTEQAEAFEDPARNQSFRSDTVGWLLEELPLRASDVALEVACGTGHIARALAPHVAVVVGVDATQAMLDVGHAQARSEGVHNVVFQVGDASALPFPAESFEIAACRFAVHHFRDPGTVVAEVGRCLRPGGRLLVIDILADERPPAAELQNHLERLRDPSHTRMLDRSGLVSLLDCAGLQARALPSRLKSRPLAPWLEQTHTSPAVVQEITGAFAAELDGGPITGFRPERREGEWWFSHRYGGVLGLRG
ncbi:MAG TPA: methyltransferase domain-containing protein [Solirubrobacteraceae bacterium]|nr:methyltransferase domain-containing protein [Solirubrobacteraceae bacterium]